MADNGVVNSGFLRTDQVSLLLFIVTNPGVANSVATSIATYVPSGCRTHVNGDISQPGAEFLARARPC